MKKLVLLAAIAAFSVTATNAQGLSFGAKAGLNLASVNGEGSDEANSRTAFHIGGVVNIEISELFAVQPEVVYSSQGFTQDFTDFIGDTFESTVKLDYLNIPVLADITVVEGLSIQGGPQFGININSEQEINGETADIDDVETMDVAAAIGAQLELPVGLFFQARFVAGLTEIAKDSDLKNTNISLSAGWFFN